MHNTQILARFKCFKNTKKYPFIKRIYDLKTLKKNMYLNINLQKIVLFFPKNIILNRVLMKYKNLAKKNMFV